MTTFSIVQPDPTIPIMGMDPMVVVGLGTIMCGIGGYFAGSIAYGSLWRIMNKNKLKQIHEVCFIQFYFFVLSPTPFFFLSITH